MEKLPVIFQWNLNFSALLVCILLIVLYYKPIIAKGLKTSISFWISLLLIVLAECSPLHYLGMHYFFSAHMITHVLLLLICGPLLVAAIPEHTESAFIIKISSVINKHSWLAWCIGVGIMWFWHVPLVFDHSFAAMGASFSVLSFLHTASMLAAGMLFSWPIFGPITADHAHPLNGIIYLFTACVSCSLLGLLITFAPLNIYNHYLEMNMGSTNPWNLSAKSDQQAAGLIMWVPCCFVYLSGCLFLLKRWFGQGEQSKNIIIINIARPE